MRTVKVVYKHSRKSASFHAASYVKNQEKKNTVQQAIDLSLIL